MTAITDATWCVIDIFSGTAYSQAVLTFNVKKNASNLLTGIGTVGYTQAGVYSATPVYYGVALAAVTVTIANNVSGPGYAEATFTRSDTGTNIYYYLAPIMGHLPGLFYDYQQSQSQTLCNGYGRLTDFNNNTIGNTCSLRVGMINGQPNYLSAGVIGQENTLPLDCLGVPVTNVGEFDETFVPHVVDNGTTRLNTIYRYNGTLFYFCIESGATNTLSRIGDNTYLVNCLSPINVVDVAAKALVTGPNDYNGRILLRSVGAIAGTSTKFVGVIQSKYINSIDTGNKLITQTFSTATDIVPGIELPSFVDRKVTDFGVNVYVADTYSTTYFSVNVTSVIGDYSGVLHVNDTRLPFAIGYTFLDGVMQTDIETIFTGVGVTGQPDVEYNYAGYELGNDILGPFQSFRLFGQRYLFDGFNVYMATFNGSLYATKEIMAPAIGMQYIAASPMAAYFLSVMDNSLYTFDGGRALGKQKRLNDIRNASDVIEAITDGVFNVRDNTLLMQTASTFIWVRDGVVTQNTKKATQTGILLFDTATGIQIANNTQLWRYPYTDPGGATVVPLVFQSAYYGMGNNILMVNTAFDVTLYSPSRANASVTLIGSYLDADGASSQVPQHLKIKASDWNALGIYRCRIRPAVEKVIAASIGVQFASKLVMSQVAMEWTEDVPAVPANSRSV